MAYKEKFVAVVKCNGKVLRERKTDSGEMFITLPFGSEYTIHFKNLHTQRAVVQVQIDGKDVLNGHQLVVEPHSDANLDGFLDLFGNNTTAAFKFIQKTKEIADHRGDRLDDGMINISFAFELPAPKPSTSITWTIPVPPPYTWTYTTTCSDPKYTKGCDSISCCTSDSSISSSNTSYLNQVADSDMPPDELLEDNSTPQSDEGITVHGSDVNQAFATTYVGAVGNYETIIIRLRGSAANGTKVTKAITTKTRINCPTCGRLYPANLKFCSNCGTNLQAALK